MLKMKLLFLWAILDLAMIWIPMRSIGALIYISSINF